MTSVWAQPESFQQFAIDFQAQQHLQEPGEKTLKKHQKSRSIGDPKMTERGSIHQIRLVAKIEHELNNKNKLDYVIM